MSKKNWVNFDGTYVYNNIPGVTKDLPLGIYELGCGMQGFFLKKVSDSFELPNPSYGLENDLIKRVKTSFGSFKKNFGLLLKGMKGTGKTVTAKQLCNELKLPVILVNSYFQNIGGFINEIEQDVVLFFDEFEKVYEFNSYTNYDQEEGEEQSGIKQTNVASLLTLMDGVFTSSYKRLFILTTNKEYMPDAMMARPSRIRYIKNFSDLNYDVIMEILTDIVKDKKLIPKLVSLISGLEIITIDIVTEKPRLAAAVCVDTIMCASVCARVLHISG